jgi:hypothetical protein
LAGIFRLDGEIVRIVRLLGIVLLTLLPFYVGSYLVLSARGCYEPAGIGLNGVKWYAWAPSGFVVHYNWRRWPIIYFPLWSLDMHVWHTDAKAKSGRYPVDEVRREDIWKVYEANGLLEKAPAAEVEKPPK